MLRFRLAVTDISGSINRSSHPPLSKWIFFYHEVNCIPPNPEITHTPTYAATKSPHVDLARFSPFFYYFESLFASNTSIFLVSDVCRLKIHVVGGCFSIFVVFVRVCF